MKGFIVVFSACFTLLNAQAYGFCEDVEEVSLLTFQWVEVRTNLKISETSVNLDIDNVGIDRDQAGEDLASYEDLFRRGYMTRHQVEAARIIFDDLELMLEAREAQLRAIDGRVEINERRILNSCGMNPLNPEDRRGFAEILIDRWQEQVDLDQPRIELAERRLAMALRRLAFVEDMHEDGYRSDRDVALANRDAEQITNEIRTLKIQRRLKREFIEALTELASHQR